MRIHRPALFSLILIAALTPLGGQARTPATDSADLTLQQPASQNEYIIDGAAWTCAGTDCHSDFVDDLPAFRSCKRIVAVTGAVTAFSYRGKSLSAAELAVCNTRAKA